MTTIKTERLVLRPWKEEDLESFAALNADPRVMEYFPSTLSQEESNQLAKRIQSHIRERGWGLWAVSVPNVADFIGFIGLNYIDGTSIPFPFAPATEIGWRLAFEYWQKGYATEGALASLQYGFEKLHLHQIVAITTCNNIRSRRVMEKTGMSRDPKDDFDHPKIPDGHPLKRHVLYRKYHHEYE